MEYLFCFFLKLEFTSVPSSPKVQATIVGTVAKTASSSDLVSKTTRYQSIQPFRTSESIAPKTIVPPSMSIVSMPSGVLTSSNISQVGGLPGTNLAVAKQVLLIKNNKMSTAHKMKFFLKDFFCKCDQIRRKLRIWSYLLKESIMEDFIFCAVE